MAGAGPARYLRRAAARPFKAGAGSGGQAVVKMLWVGAVCGPSPHCRHGDYHGLARLEPQAAGAEGGRDSADVCRVNLLQGSGEGWRLVLGWLVLCEGPGRQGA